MERISSAPLEVSGWVTERVVELTKLSYNLFEPKRARSPIYFCLLDVWAKCLNCVKSSSNTLKLKNDEILVQNKLKLKSPSAAFSST